MYFEIEQLVKELSHQLAIRGWMMTCAESCTGGLISSFMTAQPGSSKVFECGYITYSNRSKLDLLGVLPETLEKFGAVSSFCAQEMAQGALLRSGANISIAVTGIAGPDGGTQQKPVGTVFIGFARKDRYLVYENYFQGDRESIRLQTVMSALKILIEEAGL